MKIDKDKWFKFFPNDWLTGTQDLTAEERGVYITLVALMYDREGPIYDNDQRYSRRCGVSTRKYRTIKNTLIKEGKIETEKGPDGTYLTNLRVKKELNFRQTIKEQNSIAGKLSADAKKKKQKKPNKNNAHDEATVETEGATMRGRNQNHIDKKDKKRKFVYGKPDTWPEGFKEFKENYPQRKNQSWQKGGEAYLKWIGEGITPEQIMQALKAYEFSTEQKYIPHASSFLNKEYWNEIGEFDAGVDVGAASANAEWAKWRKRIENFKETGKWMPDIWGPKPLKGGEPNPDFEGPMELVLEIFEKGDL